MSDGESILYSEITLIHRARHPPFQVTYTRMDFCLTINRNSLTAVRHIDRAIKSRADKR